VPEHLPSKLKALNSNPNTAKTKKQKSNNKRKKEGKKKQ
jgi:hypothetical protein